MAACSALNVFLLLELVSIGVQLVWGGAVVTLVGHLSQIHVMGWFSLAFFRCIFRFSVLSLPFFRLPSPCLPHLSYYSP